MTIKDSKNKNLKSNNVNCKILKMAHCSFVHWKHVLTHINKCFCQLKVIMTFCTHLPKTV